MRRVSVNARTAHDAASTDAVEVALMVFEHADLEAPLRLSTDPTERLSTDPLTYGTRSRWNDADPLEDPYLFVMAEAALPGDMEDGPAPAEIILVNLDAGIAEVLRSVTSRATVHFAVVMSDTPDIVETEFRDMRLMEAGGDAAEYRLQITRLPIEEESVPSDRMTKQRFPGMWR